MVGGELLSECEVFEGQSCSWNECEPKRSEGHSKITGAAMRRRPMERTRANMAWPEAADWASGVGVGSLSPGCEIAKSRVGILRLELGRQFRSGRLGKLIGVVAPDGNRF